MNVRIRGSLSDQSAQFFAAISTRNEKCIELLALSETHWTGHAVVKFHSPTVICSGSSSFRIHGVAKLSSAHMPVWFRRLQDMSSILSEL